MDTNLETVLVLKIEDLESRLQELQRLQSQRIDLVVGLDSAQKKVEYLQSEISKIDQKIEERLRGESGGSTSNQKERISARNPRLGTEESAQSDSSPLDLVDSTKRPLRPDFIPTRPVIGKDLMVLCRTDVEMQRKFDEG